MLIPIVFLPFATGVSKVCAQPLFQAGCKYWLVLVLVYTATLLAMHFDTAIASLTPAFGYVAAVLTMSERVEATVSKVGNGCNLHAVVSVRTVRKLNE